MDHQRRLNGRGLGVELPRDYLMNLKEAIESSFAKTDSFRVYTAGKMWPDEILIALGVSHQDYRETLTVFGSLEMNPADHTETLEPLLTAGFETLQAVLGELLEERLNAKMPKSFDAFTLRITQERPSHWVQQAQAKTPFFIRIDRSNIELDEAADRFLAEHLDEDELQADRDAANQLFSARFKGDLN